eukprot:m.137755 g.137755  ORF g.137755 m.137755 type:complete len:254 (-) comp15900_c0_seq5:113-874(-)
MAENIVFIIDVSEEIGQCPFDDRRSGSRLEHVKAAIKRFVDFKARLSSSHRYGLAVLTHEFIWLSKPDAAQAFLDLLPHVEAQGSFPECDFNTVCRAMQSLVSKCSSNESVRAILVYSRSHVLPLISDVDLQQAKQGLLKDGRFVLDLVYLFDRRAASVSPAAEMRQDSPEQTEGLHDSVSLKEPSIVPSAIFDFFTSLDVNANRFHMYSASSSVLHLYQGFAALLGHPSQRPPFDRVNHELFPALEDDEEVL